MTIMIIRLLHEPRDIVHFHSQVFPKTCKEAWIANRKFIDATRASQNNQQLVKSSSEYEQEFLAGREQAKRRLLIELGMNPKPIYEEDAKS